MPSVICVLSDTEEAQRVRLGRQKNVVFSYLYLVIIELLFALLWGHAILYECALML